MLTHESRIHLQLKPENQFFQIVFAISILTLCQSTTAGGVYTADGVVSQLASEGGIIVIKVIANDIYHADDCDETGEVILDDQTKNGDRQFALLMAAMATKSSVHIYTSGCFFAWGQNYPKLWSVRVKD